MSTAFLEKTPGLLIPSFDKDHPNMGWVRKANGVAVFGYVSICLISGYLGSGGLSMLLQEGMATLILCIAFALSGKRPLLAVYITLGTVFWEVCLSYFHCQSIEVTSVGVFPVLILSGGMLLGVRGVTVLAIASSLSGPLMVYLSGGWGYDFQKFRPAIDGDGLAVFELTIVVTAILTRSVLIAYNRAHSISELARQRYMDLFENVPDGLVALDESSRIVEANRAACGMFGSDITHLRGAILNKAWKNAGGLGEIDLRAALAGSLLSLEVRNSEGLSHHLELSARAEPSRNSHSLLVIRDVTQRKLVEDRLGHAQRLECVGQLAGGVAHDFNNLLTVIGGNSSFLHSNRDPEVRALAADIIQASKRGASLIRQLLAFAKRDIHRPAVINMASSFKAMTRLLGPLLGEHCRINVACPENIHVLFDHTQLEQVIMNLVSNARDAMPAGGEVRLSVLALDLGSAEALGSVLTCTRQVLIEVADSGIGMSEEVKARVFEPFFSTKPRGHGTGLGLASVHGIVAQNKGSIHIDSAPGHGTRMRVFVPLDEGGGVHAGLPKEAKTPEGRGQHILLVEDEDNVRSLVSRILSRGGYRVTEAPEAETAMGLFSMHRDIDLLLTDVVMPGLSGPSLVNKIRSRRPDLPVLFMSGHFQDEVDKHAAGSVDIAAHLIAKPFTAEQLIERVHGALHPGRR